MAWGLLSPWPWGGDLGLSKVTSRCGGLVLAGFICSLSEKLL
jgi:hypothetical protein